MKVIACCSAASRGIEFPEWTGNRTWMSGWPSRFPTAVRKSAQRLIASGSSGVQDAVDTLDAPIEDSGGTIDVAAARLGEETLNEEATDDPGDTTEVAAASPGVEAWMGKVAMEDSWDTANVAAKKPGAEDGRASCSTALPDPPSVADGAVAVIAGASPGSDSEDHDISRHKPRLVRGSMPPSMPPTKPPLPKLFVALLEPSTIGI